jgi:hypothetical protein
MAANFGAKSTTEDVLAGVDLKGKRMLVTGVSAGLGVEQRVRSWPMEQMLWARRVIWRRQSARPRK